MFCKSCKREIPENSLYCNWCGVRQLREKKKKADISIPAARQLKSGAWNIELRAEKQSVTEPTKALCEAKARAIRAGFIERKAECRDTMRQLSQKYIDDRRNVLSPSTIRGDLYYLKRFQSVLDLPPHKIDWQAAINEEQKRLSAKTVANTWHFFASVLRANDLPVPKVSLKQVVTGNEPWLDFEQIQTFLKAVRDKPCEIGALLALNSLRRSELLAIKPENFYRRGDCWYISVHGAIVRDADEKMVFKEENKNSTSRREVPVVNERLIELIQDKPKGECLVTCNENTLRDRINRVCVSAGLPKVGVHGLRRSFASLAFHLGWDILYTQRVGGWKDDRILKKIYTKLSSQDIAVNVETMRQFNREVYE